jgi:hypothetical protein
MRRLMAGVLPLLFSGCGWPPFPNECGTSGWTNLGANLTISSQLNAVFSTQNAVFAVGNNGLILRVVSNGSSALVMLKNNDNLHSLWVKDNSMTIVGNLGVYSINVEIFHTPSLLSQEPVKTASDCFDVWIQDQVSIVTCANSILVQTSSSSPWESRNIPSVSFRSVAATPEYAIASADYGYLFQATLPTLSHWIKLEKGLKSQTPRDTWSDGHDTIFQVGNAGEYTAFSKGILTANNATLPSEIQNADILSIWGSEGNGNIVLSGIISPIPPDTMARGFVWESRNSMALETDKQRFYFGVHGNQRNLYAVGRMADTGAGFIRCRPH